MFYVSNSKYEWLYDVKTLSALLALCEGKSPFTGGSPHKGAVRQSYDLFFSINVNKPLNRVELLVIWDTMTLIWCDNKTKV